jgi:hypothetical protein
MGSHDLDRIGIEVHDVEVSEKTASKRSLDMVTTPKDEDFAKGYVDPKEERAFVSCHAHNISEAKRLMVSRCGSWTYGSLR